MKDVKLIGKIGRKHRTDPSSLTEPTNVLTVQVTMEHVIVQQDSNHMHHPGPVNRDQLFKIQEVLRHPSQYRDKLPPNKQPATAEYAKSFNKFCPKKGEVNEATIDEVVGFGNFMKKSDAEVTEAIDLYKALRDNIPYGPEDQSAEPPQQD